MNLKKQALNSIIKAMRKNPKGKSIVSFYTTLNYNYEENNQVILSDSYAFMILPVEELSSKDMERIESIFYKVNVFQRRDCDYIKYGKQPLIESQRKLIDLLNSKFFDKHVFNIKLDKSSDEVLNCGSMDLVKYANKDDHIQRYIDTKYEGLLCNPNTYHDEYNHGLLLSVLDNKIITGVLPVKRDKKEE
jgi:hypothetical protein